MKKYSYLVCLDMDRVLVDHLSTWQLFTISWESLMMSRLNYTIKIVMNGLD